MQDPDSDELIPTHPPPKRPDAVPDEDDPAEAPTPRAPQAPPRAPSQREAGRHRVGKPTPPGGTPVVISRLRDPQRGVHGAGILLLTR